MARGSKWRERERELHKSLTIGRSIFDNWRNCMFFIKSFWQIVKEWPADCQRLQKKHTLFSPIVKDWPADCQRLKKKSRIVKDWPADCQRLPDSHSRSRNSFSSFNPPSNGNEYTLDSLNLVQIDRLCTYAYSLLFTMCTSQMSKKP